MKLDFRQFATDSTYMEMFPLNLTSVANSLEYVHSPAGDLPRKPGSPDQMLIALIDNEWSF